MRDHAPNSGELRGGLPSRVRTLYMANVLDALPPPLHRFWGETQARERTTQEIGRRALDLFEQDGMAGIAYMVTKRPDSYTAEERRFEDDILEAAARAFPEAMRGHSPLTRQEFAQEPKPLRQSRTASATSTF
jgi:hypothetical protein